MELYTRLQILKEAGTITDKAYRVTTQVVEEQVPDDLHENYAMLVTHLAMALTRIEQNEALTGPGDAVMEEVLASPHLPAAKEAVEKIESLVGEPLPKEEQQFLYMHFVSTFSSVS